MEVSLPHLETEILIRLLQSFGCAWSKVLCHLLHLRRTKSIDRSNRFNSRVSRVARGYDEAERSLERQRFHLAIISTRLLRPTSPGGDACMR